MSGTTEGDEPPPQSHADPERWTPRGSPEPALSSSDDVRWHTAWGLLFGSLLVSACAFVAAWFDYQSAQAFARSAHLVTGEVVESDCWVLCKGGPYVDVAYDRPGSGRVVARFDGPMRHHYRVGEKLDVIYSDDPDSLGYVVLPPAEPYYRSGQLWWSIVGAAGLLLAALAWVFPANLRRLDRRAAARSAQQSPG